MLFFDNFWQFRWFCYFDTQSWCTRNCWLLCISAQNLYCFGVRHFLIFKQLHIDQINIISEIFCSLWESCSCQWRICREQWNQLVVRLDWPVVDLVQGSCFISSEMYKIVAFQHNKSIWGTSIWSTKQANITSRSSWHAMVRLDDSRKRKPADEKWKRIYVIHVRLCNCMVHMPR